MIVRSSNAIELLSRRSITDVTRREHTAELFLLLAGRAKTGWNSNTVIRCCRNRSSFSFVMDIYNFVRLDTGVLVF